MALQFWQQYSKLTAWYPTNLPGCTLWLNAGYGITKDGSDYVSLWLDKSGANNNAIQNTANRQPLYIANAVNGQPVLRFDGVDAVGDYMSFPDINNIRTFFLVMKHRTGNAEYSATLGNTTTYDFNGGHETALFSGEYTSPYIYSGDGYVNGISTAPLSMIKPTTPSIICVVTTGNVRANLIANDRDVINHYWDGDFAEILLYSVPLGTSDRQLVEDYLSVKYFSFKNIIPKMTSNTAPSGVASASFAVGGNAFYAFDKTINNEWNTVAYAGLLPQWIAYEFTTPRTIKKYAITGTVAYNNNYNPKSWQFQGYDGANWIDLDVVINEAQFEVYERREYVVDTPTSYTSYRLYVTAAQSYQQYQHVIITEIEMSEI